MSVISYTDEYGDTLVVNSDTDEGDIPDRVQFKIEPDDYDEEYDDPDFVLLNVRQSVQLIEQLQQFVKENQL